MILPLPLPLILTLSQVILYLPYISAISPAYLPDALAPSVRQVIRVNHAPVAHSAAGRRYAWLGLGLG